MADLRALVEGLGGTDVRTYVQSGNVIFRSRNAPGRLEDALGKAIRTSLGLEVIVLVRTTSQLARIVAGNPFLASGADPAKLHATLLAAKPDRGRVRELSAAGFAPDEFAIVGDT